ncbi:MAG: DUF393 domain-containing protein [Waddliaceae bacterium]
MNKHLVFYDGRCGLCDRTVQFLLSRDKNKQFLFAPLQGKTAEEYRFPPEVKSADSLILIENYGSDEHMYLFAKAAFRIFWHLGGAFRIVGWLGFLPGFLFNWGYHLIARVRYQIFGKVVCKIPDPDFKDQFLP